MAVLRTNFGIKQDRYTTGMEIFELADIIDFAIDYNPLRKGNKHVNWKYMVS